MGNSKRNLQEKSAEGDKIGLIQIRRDHVTGLEIPAFRGFWPFCGPRSIISQIYDRSPFMNAFGIPLKLLSHNNIEAQQILRLFSSRTPCGTCVAQHPEFSPFKMLRLNWLCNKWRAYGKATFCELYSTILRL